MIDDKPCVNGNGEAFIVDMSNTWYNSNGYNTHMNNMALGYCYGLKAGSYRVRIKNEVREGHLSGVEGNPYLGWNGATNNPGPTVAAIEVYEEGLEGFLPPPNEVSGTAMQHSPSLSNNHLTDESFNTGTDSRSSIDIGENFNELRFDESEIESRPAGWSSTGTILAVGSKTVGSGKLKSDSGNTFASLKQDYSESCSHIQARDPASLSGVYRIKPRGVNTPFSVYCDMADDEGGWTLVFKSVSSYSCSSELVSNSINTVYTKGTCAGSGIDSKSYGACSERAPLTAIDSLLRSGESTIRLTKENNHVVYYKRLSLHGVDYSKSFFKFSKESDFYSGRLNQEFALYSTYDDAQKNTNRWEYCDYEDTVGQGVGFPSSCGKEQASPGIALSQTDCNAPIDKGMLWIKTEYPVNPISKITQGISGLIRGSEYVMSFSAASKPNSQQASAQIQVSMGKQWYKAIFSASNLNDMFNFDNVNTWSSTVGFKKRFKYS
jgi:hypothetical protein